MNIGLGNEHLHQTLLLIYGVFFLFPSPLQEINVLFKLSTSYGLCPVNRSPNASRDTPIRTLLDLLIVTSNLISRVSFSEFFGVFLVGLFSFCLVVFVRFFV